MGWRRISDDMPGEPVLLWIDGTCAIGVAVRGPAHGHGHVFMDPRNDALLGEATHWMPLPGSP